ncbi:GNAT family N-acetyltransferase [Rubripirellula sp.]|nr:GNAT family N-acetyltransferase [Rubripirellula sp.]MDB4338839.1 GNAT family N-acetyltransferase [Rubripirellula sp.]
MTPLLECHIISGDALLKCLPQFTADLSLARTLVLTDQIQNSPDTVLAFAVDEKSSRSESLALAVIGLPTPITATSMAGTGKTLDAEVSFHSAPVTPAVVFHVSFRNESRSSTSDQPQASCIAECLWDEIEKEMQMRHIECLQWFLEPFETGTLENPQQFSSAKEQSELVSEPWVKHFRFQFLANLQHFDILLSSAKESASHNNIHVPDDTCDTADSNPNNRCDLNVRVSDSQLISESPNTPSALTFEPLDWKSPTCLRDFAELVKSTYEDTLDCPKFGSEQSAEKTLSSYQKNGTFNQNEWYTVRQIDSDLPIGCLILGSIFSTNQRISTDPSHDGDGITELVYMGLKKGFRGKGFGKYLLAFANRQASRHSHGRMIVAVDQQNRPATQLYSKSGMRCVFRESVWTRSIDPPTG